MMPERFRQAEQAEERRGNYGWITQAVILALCAVVFMAWEYPNYIEQRYVSFHASHGG